MSVEKEFYKIIKDFLDIDISEIELTITLRELDIDSLDILELKMICEEKFNIELYDDIFETEHPTIENIIEKLEELIDGRKE